MRTTSVAVMTIFLMESVIRKYLITDMFQVLSQQLQGSLATAFERNLTSDDCTHMDQHRWPACMNAFAFITLFSHVWTESYPYFPEFQVREDTDQRKPVFRHILCRARCKVSKVNIKDTRICKINNEDTVDVVLVSWLLTLNTFPFLLQCFYC